VQGGRALPVAGGRFEVRERHQIATFQDFCNDCGNCDTFCPEDGGPYLEKPRFFGSLEAWRQQAGRDGFYVRTREGADTMWGRLGGVVYRLEVSREADQAVFTDGRVTLELRHRDGRTTPVLYNASLYRDDSGQVLGVFAAARDVTRVLKRVGDSRRPPLAPAPAIWGIV
jgi:hypothetical protein